MEIGESAQGVGGEYGTAGGDGVFDIAHGGAVCIDDGETA